MKIKIYSKVGKDVSKLFLKTIRALQKVSPSIKGLNIILAPETCVGVADGSKRGFGVFFVRGKYIGIAIGGKYSNDMKKDISRKDWIKSIPETIAHEWAHMEQWRDKRPLNHKGIDKRVKELLKATP